eukprot:8842515-Alexandrium_andersonii.AAC.1
MTASSSIAPKALSSPPELQVSWHPRKQSLALEAPRTGSLEAPTSLELQHGRRLFSAVCARARP